MMNKIPRTALLVALAFALALSGVSAESKTSLNIQSNQSGARVYLNDTLAGYTAPNFSVLVNPGLYTVRVVKDGYPEFKTTVVVGSSPITITANIGGGSYKPPVTPPPVVTQYPLTIESSVPGATVYINGAYGGVAPYVGYFRSGTYTVSVRVAGYQEYVQIVKLGSAFRLFAALSPAYYPVSIDVPNLPGAAIYRDSVYVGTTPYRNSWPAGSYNIRISVPGYLDYADRILVAGPFTMQTTLSPALVDYEIRLPEAFAQNNGKPLSFKSVDAYLDGQKLDSPYGRVMPGLHRLVLFISGFRFESEFELQPGKPSILEPYLGVRIK